MLEIVSLSDRWWTISAADHLPASGCAVSWPAGMASRLFATSAAPSAYWRISRCRSSWVIGVLSGAAERPSGREAAAPRSRVARVAAGTLTGRGPDGSTYRFRDLAHREAP